MIALALLLVIAGVSGQTSATAKTSTAKQTPDPNKRTCRREMATGSNMSRAVCHTRAEWDAIARANSDAAERVRGPMGVQPQQQ